jgi:uncharacterized membrane protein YgaE (UPF0421/DUF939 family)
MARLRDPLLWTEISQLLKTVGAAVIAWLLAGHLFGVAQPFLAPWAALLTVNATVYRTFARGLQQVAAAVLGVLLAFAVGSLLGVGTVSLGLMLLAAMAVGRTRALRPEATTAGATGIVVLLAGYSSEHGVLAARLLDTVIGIGVGLLVNLLVWPPLHDRAAARQIDRLDDELGDLLSTIAREIREADEEIDADAWVERTRDIDREIDAAWAGVRQARESGRLNLRRQAAPRVRATADFADVLERLEQAGAEARSMARTIGRTGARLADWDARFHETWVDLLARTGAAVTDADPSAIERVRGDIDEAVGALSGRSGALRPAQGALLVNLRNIADAVEDVAAAQPVRSAAPPRPRVVRPNSRV